MGRELGDNVTVSCSWSINLLTETFVTKERGLWDLMKCKKNVQNDKKQTFFLGSDIFYTSDL